MPRSFFLGLFLLAMTLMFLGVDALFWWKVLPSNPIELGSIGMLGFVAMPHGIVVSHNNLNIGTIHPAMLGTAPGIAAAVIFAFSVWDRRRKKRGFPLAETDDQRRQ
jgi:hypothetical protein